MASTADNVITATGGSSTSFADAVCAAIEGSKESDPSYQMCRFTSYEVVQLKGPIEDRGRPGNSSATPASFDVVVNITYEDFR